MARLVRNVGCVILSLVAALWLSARVEAGGILSPPVRDVTFDPVKCFDAVYREIVTQNRRVISDETIKFDPTTTVARVINQVIYIDEFKNSNSDSDSITWDLDPASLVRALIGSRFAGTGVAHSHTDEDEDIPVKYTGTIVQIGGKYYLRMFVRGIKSESNSETETDIVHVTLTGSASVPPP